MLEVIVALIGIIVTTMVMIAGLQTFRSWGQDQGVEQEYPAEQEAEDPVQIARTR